MKGRAGDIKTKTRARAPARPLTWACLWTHRVLRLVCEISKSSLLPGLQRDCQGPGGVCSSAPGMEYPLVIPPSDVYPPPEGRRAPRRSLQPGQKGTKKWRPRHPVPEQAAERSPSIWVPSLSASQPSTPPLPPCTATFTTYTEQPCTPAHARTRVHRRAGSPTPNTRRDPIAHTRSMPAGTGACT